MTGSLFRYVALGDSTGVGVGASLDGGYPERLFRRLKSAGVHAGIVNLAESGATTQGLVERQLERAAQLRPHLVTLGVGANDVWRLVPEEAFAANVRRIADALEQTGARVLVNNLPDLGAAPVAAMVETYLQVPLAVIEARLRAFNAHLEALAGRRGFEVLDLFTLSRRDVQAGADCFCDDGFHPSAAAYDRWAQHLWGLLAADPPKAAAS